MQRAWASALASLRRFRGEAVALVAETPWDSGEQASVTLRILPGDLFDSPAVVLLLAVGMGGTAALMHAAEDDSSLETLPEGVLEAIEGIASSLDECTQASDPASALRSVLLRLSDDLCLELDPGDRAALNNLGRAAEFCATVPAAALAVPAVPALARVVTDASQATSAFSLESDLEASDDDGTVADAGDDAHAAADPPLAAIHEAPEAERPRESVLSKDVLRWRCFVDNLARLGENVLEVASGGTWDGTEAILVLALVNPQETEAWDRLAVVFVVSATGVHVEAKGAQVVPEAARLAIAESRHAPAAGGVGGVRDALCTLFAALDMELSPVLLAFLEKEQTDDSLSEFGASAGVGWWRKCSDGRQASSSLDGQMLAIEALGVQLGFIDGQVLYLTQKQENSTDPSSVHCLIHEVSELSRTRVFVNAEKEAAEKAVSSVLAQSSSRAGLSNERVVVNVFPGPAQSLRGRTPTAAGEEIAARLRGQGPWGHYAAYQFSCMLQREQELHGDFICLYHSYSHASLLYEVHAEIARWLFKLSDDFPPLPRLGVPHGAPADAQTLQNLMETGQQDHAQAFRALGLSSSCSVFASASEAPPLNCFCEGYSCTGVDLRNLLKTFLQSCCHSTSMKGLVDAVVEVGRKHMLPLGMFGSTAGSREGLTGYMLQIFIHRSIAETFAYPSEPMGVPIDQSITGYTMSEGSSANGQARIAFHPPTFLDPKKARLFHFCARPLQSCMSSRVPESRGSLIRELRALLQPALKPRAKVLQALNL